RLIISRVSFRSRGERYGCHLFSGMCVCITNPCRMFVVVLRLFVATDPGVVPKGPQPGGRVMSAPLRSNIAGAHVSSAGLRTGGAQRLGRRIVLPLALSLPFGCVACSDDEPTPPSADTGTISGTVRRTTGGGVSGVQVALSGPVDRTTTTSSSGSYSFDNLEPGEYTVSIDLPDGYNRPEGSSASRSATVSAGRTVTVNFDLVAEGAEDVVVVELVGTSFSPSTVTISVGQTVRWVWVS